MGSSLRQVEGSSTVDQMCSGTISVFPITGRAGESAASSVTVISRPSASMVSIRLQTPAVSLAGKSFSIWKV